MSQLNAERKTLEVLAEQFVARYRRGERPALTEYINDHPELAAEIRELFPTLVIIEELAPSDSEAIAMPTPPIAQPPRLELGDYRLLREIGRGGMGIVYEAEQVSLGRRVALKMLRQTAGDATTRQRFHREARAAAQLHHTNIVPVFEVGENNDTCWYAMQLILGQGLDQIIEELRQQRLAARRTDLQSVPAGREDLKSVPARRTDLKSVPQVSQVTQSLLSGRFACPDLDPSTPPPVESSSETAAIDATESGRLACRSELSGVDSSGGPYYRSVARIGRQVSEALAHAHARGIIHRDIKPSNLLLDAAGVVWITDFGLAKTQDAALTITGDIVGTVRYMAPERLKGEGDERSDVYALGLTLYELLVLRPAFAARDRLEVIERIKNEEPPRLRSLDRRIPRDLETILLKAIDKEAKRRYATAEALAEDLRRFLANEPIQARRTSQLERLRLWSRRNPAIAMLSGGIALLLVLLSLGSTLAALWLNRMANEARQSERDAIERLFEASLTRSRAGRTSRAVGQHFDSWKALAQAVENAHILQKGPADWLALRNEAIACLTLPDLRLYQAWEGNPPGTTGIAFDPLFERYAWCYKGDDIRIYQVNDQHEIMRLPPLDAEAPEPWRDLRFSPDGQFLTVWHFVRPVHRPLQVWRLQAGVKQPLLTIPDACCNPVFLPRERTLAVGLADHSLAYYALDTGQEKKRISLGFAVQNLALAPDGRRCAVCGSAKSGVQIRSLETGKVVRNLLHSANVMTLAWHPDGVQLAAGCEDQRIYLWDTQSEKPPSILEGHRWELHEVAFDSSGDWLLSFSWDMTLRFWDVRLRKQLLNLPHGRLVGIRNDERLLAANLAGRQVQLWECVPSRAYRLLHGHERRLEDVAFSPDGRWLASSGWDAHFCLWDTAAGRMAARQNDPCVESLRLFWEPEGESVCTLARGSLHRWSVQSTLGKNRPELRLGPVQCLLPSAAKRTEGRVALFGKDKRLLGICCLPEGSFDVIQLSNPPRKLWTRRWPNVNFISGSPDGRWVATGTFDGGSGVCVWDARTGRLEKALPIGNAEVAFSPDGRWLAATTGRVSDNGAECHTWRVGSWEPGPRIPLERMSSSPPPLAFSPDGKILAVVHNTNDVRLLNADTLEDIATLTSPDPLLITRLAFSPDGGQLAATANNYVQLWDLRIIRERLTELGLDWDAPPLPAVSARQRGAVSEEP